MSSLRNLSPTAFAPAALAPGGARAAERPAGGTAAAWLADAADDAGGDTLHVSPHDPGLSLDRIEQDFLAALCEAPR